MTKNFQGFSGGFRLLTVSLAFGAISFSVAKNIHTFQLGLVAVSVFLFAVPIMLSGIYVGTLRRVHENTLFKRDGWLYRFRSKRLFMVIGWFAWSVTTGFFMLIQLNLYTQQEWLAFFMTFPLFYIVFTLCRHILAKNVQPLHTIRISIDWTRWIVPGVMVLVYGLLFWQAEPTQSTLTLRDAIDAKRIHLLKDASTSAVIDEALQIFSFMSGARDYAGSKFDTLWKGWSWAFTVLSSFVVSYNVCVLLSCMMISPKEYRRIFGKMSDNPDPPEITPLQVASLSAIITFLFFFVYLHGFVALETWIKQSPNLAQGRKELEEVVVVKIDEIAGKPYKPGTIKKIEDARAQVLRASASAVHELDQKIDGAFSMMERNVDPYLDWYYSLSAEYARMAMTLSGGIEGHMTGKLKEYLFKNDPLKTVSVAMNGALERQKGALREYQSKRDQILRENQINVTTEPTRVMRQMSKKDLDLMPMHPTVTTIESRMAGAAVASVVTGLVTTKVVSKVVGKGVFKLAVTAASKLVVSKTVSVAAGTATGAAIGSIFPGVGTLIGAGLGALTGAVIGVGMDATILKLEEKVSRDAFKREILESIQASKKEFKNGLFGKAASTGI